jgi:hypothetical protein
MAWLILQVVKVANQKKPAALLGAVFRQLTHQEAKGEFGKIFQAMFVPRFPFVSLVFPSSRSR